jgi:hypothetical protein
MRPDGNRNGAVGSGDLLAVQRELIVDPLFGIDAPCKLASLLFALPEDFSLTGHRILLDRIALVFSHWFGPRLSGCGARGVCSI